MKLVKGLALLMTLAVLASCSQRSLSISSDELGLESNSQNQVAAEQKATDPATLAVASKAMLTTGMSSDEILAAILKVDLDLLLKSEVGVKGKALLLKSLRLADDSCQMGLYSLKDGKIDAEVMPAFSGTCKAPADIASMKALIAKFQTDLAAEI